LYFLNIFCGGKMLWIRIGFNADSSPDPAFEVKSDLDLLPNLVLRVLITKN
jgi:hypothetical protein